MDLGAFSVSLAVKDLGKSKAFYEQLGFTEYGGNIDQNWVILKNRNHVIGLFQGMFEQNIMTFNPGWEQDASESESFTDIREIQKALAANGIEAGDPIEEGSSGPASLMLTDPDGNPILIDQHR